jgi:hypothetical protein
VALRQPTPFLEDLGQGWGHTPKSTVGKVKTTGQFGNLTGNGLIFEKVTGQRVAVVAA